MERPVLLHPHPGIARDHFPDCRIQRPTEALPTDVDRIICFPDWIQGLLPDLASARTLVGGLKKRNPGRVTLVSSALFYGASCRNPGLMRETRVTPSRLLSPVPRAWRELEALFQEVFPGRLTVLRTAPCPFIEPDSLFGTLLEQRRIPILHPFDPPLQFLHPRDLAHALDTAWETPAGETFNIAPSEILRPRLLAKARGWRTARLGSLYQGTAELKREVADCFRYPWTISLDKARIELGFSPAYGSFEALGLPAPLARERAQLDPFGMDPDYIANYCSGIAGFLHKRYFRVDYLGEERLPSSGNGILLGIHRGFMPFDALMLLVYFVTRRKEIIRVPSHQSLHKTPVPFNFAKMGGIPASADNIDRIIHSGQWVLLFPEGINGAFRLYKDAYRLGTSGFKETLECAIRNQVPIVPVLTVGSAEIFPILKKLQWKWMQNKTLWPAFPLAPPFPLLPVPLPTKWKTVFLEPLEIQGRYAPEDAGDRDITGRLGAEIRERMQAGLLELRAERESWWW